MRASLLSRLTVLARELRGRIHERVLVYRAGDATEPAIEVRRLSREEADRWGVPYSAETLSANEMNGWRLYAYFHANVPASFAWARLATEHHITEIGTRVRAEREVGWIVHCITPEAHRGRGYYPRLIRQVARALGATTYIYCIDSNIGSRRGIERAGFVPIGTLSRTLGRLSNTVTGLRVVTEKA